MPLTPQEVAVLRPPMGGVGWNGQGRCFRLIGIGAR
jgi:hypothetical protein